jgi:hypothetical protein
MMIAHIQDTTDDLHENKTVAIVILVLIFAIAIWKAWPSLRANNVFSKKRQYDYGRGEEVIGRKRTAAIKGIGFALLLGFAGIALMLYRTVHPIGDVSYSTRQSRPINPETLFFLSFFGIVATLIYTFIDENSFAAIHNIKYTLKIWLTTMFLSPLILIAMDFHRVVNTQWFFGLYVNTLWLAHGLGVATLTIIMLAVNYFTKLPWKAPKKRLYILLIAELSLLINMFIIALTINSGMRWLLEVLPYMAVIGLCIWFYPFDPHVYSDESAHAAEVID